MHARYWLALVAFMSSTQAFAVDWLQDTPAVFDQLRANREWTCAPTANSLGGTENALACTITSVNSRKVGYRFALTATPSTSGKWITEFTIAVVPIHAIPDAEINERYFSLADFPYRGAQLKDRYRTIDDMLTACRSQGEKRGLQCALSETGEHFESLIVTASTDVAADKTFFVVTVSAGRNARCLREPECVRYYPK